MSVIKVIEVLAESKYGWEAAAEAAVKEASKTIKNIQSVYVTNMRAMVENDEVVCYHINAKVAFEIDS